MPLQAKCPICRKATTQGNEFFPFCSERCQMIDLGKWADEEYRIPGADSERIAGQDDEDSDHEIRNR